MDPTGIGSLFQVQTTLFTLWGYPMSVIEFAGTALNLLSVWLVARKSIWTWPVGNAAVVLFGILFYQIRLYADFFEQVYFLVTGFYGWWLWLRLARGRQPAEEKLGVRILTARTRALLLGGLAACTAGTGFLMANLHVLLPRVFPEEASYPFPDAGTTVMSFAAQLLMAYRRLESWMLWIAVDVVGVWLYRVKEVRLIALLYAVFLCLAIGGLVNWRRELAETPA